MDKPSTQPPRTTRLKEGCWVCQNLHSPAHLIIHETPTTVAKLNPDQLFTGYTFLGLRWHEEDFHKLTVKERTAFLDDMTIISEAINKALRPDKMNYELLGNAQPHLHWHIVPRYETDPMWGRPIWAGSRRQKRLTSDEYVDLVKKIKKQLPAEAKPSKPPTG